MRVYVAGKTSDIVTVRRVQALAKDYGFTITYDWTRAVEREGGSANEANVPIERQKEYALADKLGVAFCDILIVCGHPHLCGTLIEYGMALAWDKQIWLHNWEQCSRISIFDHSPGVLKIEDLSHLCTALANAQATNHALLKELNG